MMVCSHLEDAEAIITGSLSPLSALRFSETPQVQTLIMWSVSSQAKKDASGGNQQKKRNMSGGQIYTDSTNKNTEEE